ncbi:hypothetical protein [Microbacterium sp. NIBRBAC000506063]|uniref:hypothetical protein n=1 Tax=Microbacterium sp. NIBRBAC000506063 TaxID=2734618 RepID=UPI0021D47310|nr:hypothetical protein [Microbacterium sp. NIBRBAC000506063]
MTTAGRAGQVAIGGTAGVGAGADVQVITKDVRAWIAPGAAVAANGNITIDATSNDKIVSISAGGSGGGTVGVSVNASVSVFSLTTVASVGEVCEAANPTAANCASSRATVIAGGSVRIAALGELEVDVIVGSIALGGTVGVGAGAAVPIVDQTTRSFIGDNSIVTALGLLGTGIRVHTGGFEVTPIDTRFVPVVTGGNVLNLGYSHGFRDGQMVQYDAGGGGAIGGLVDGNNYIVHVVSDTEVRLSAVDGDGTPISLSLAGTTGESHRLTDTDVATLPQSNAPYFTPGTAISGDTISLPYDIEDLATGDALIYTSGGGQAIGGLVDGTTYYVRLVAGGFQLYAEKCAALGECAGAAITLNAGTSTGRSHSLVPQGGQPSPPASATSGVREVSLHTADGFVGVSVTANGRVDVAAIGVTMAASGTVGVAVGGTVNVITSDTDAFIGRIAQVAAGSATSPGSVFVGAGHDVSVLMVSASVAIGGAGVGAGASAAVGVVNITTDAAIRAGATVTAATDVIVSALGSESVVAAAAAAAGALVGIAGASAVVVLDIHTHAVIARSTVHARGSVVVDAASDTAIVVVGGGAAGGFVGVGIGVGVTTVTKDTQAYIAAGSVVDAEGRAPAVAGILSGVFDAAGRFGIRPGFTGLAVQARSTQEVFGLAVSLGAGFVGVGVSVTTTILNITTRAFIDSTSALRTQINQTHAGGPNQSVSVTAANASKTLTIAGGIGGGFVGVSGGIDIGILAVTTQAFVGPFAVITVANDFSLAALASAKVSTFGLSIGVGFVGAAGAVSVWSVGAPGTDEYTDGTDSSDPTARDGGNALDDADHRASGQGQGGYRGILDEAGSDTGSEADSRINAQIGAASGRLGAAAPDDPGIGASFRADDLPRGTSAFLGQGSSSTPAARSR